MKILKFFTKQQFESVENYILIHYNDHKKFFKVVVGRLDKFRSGQRSLGCEYNSHM